MALGQEETRPEPRVVDEFHVNSDVDRDKDAQHHTIGTNTSQAAAGNHSHNGSDSVLLLDGFEITGSRGGNTSILSIILALERLGAKNSTTA